MGLDWNANRGDLNYFKSGVFIKKYRLPIYGF